MIVPMSHITLLCLDSDKPMALDQLAGLGVLHIATKVTETETILSARRAEGGGATRRCCCSSCRCRRSDATVVQARGPDR